jgi:hypothetical protein
VKGKEKSLTTGTNKEFFIFFERNELQLLDFEKKTNLQTSTIGSTNR